MARYNKVDVSLWADARFKSLSPLRPSAQALWIYLLIGPNSQRIPGVILAGKMTISDQLGWQKRHTSTLFLSLVEKGMIRYCDASRIIWVRNAIKYNPPANGKIVLSWKQPWLEVPECLLKDDIRQALTDVLRPKFYREILEVFGQGKEPAEPYGMANGMADGMPNGIANSMATHITHSIYHIANNTYSIPLTPFPSQANGEEATREKEPVEQSKEVTIPNPSEEPKPAIVSDPPPIAKDAPGNVSDGPVEDFFIPNVAKALAALYGDLVTRHKPSGGIIEARRLLAAGVREAKLRTAIASYGMDCDRQKIDPEFRKSAARFFRDGIWEEYADGVLPVMPAPKDSQSSLRARIEERSKKREQG